MAAALNLNPLPLPLPVSIHHRNQPPPSFSSSFAAAATFPSALTPTFHSKCHHRHRLLHYSFSPSSPTPFPFSHYQIQTPKEPSSDDSLVEDRAIGDCLVFEEGAFEDDVLHPFEVEVWRDSTPQAAAVAAEDGESLVPEKWKEAVAEINLSKKEKQAISRELRFGSKVERRKQTSRNDLEEYLTYRQMKLSQLRPIVLDNPVDLPPMPLAMEDGEKDKDFGGKKVAERVVPRNPRLEVAGEGLESISEFFNSGDYVPGEVYDQKKPKGSRKLLTKEEKVLLNKRIPSLSEATSGNWIPLHTLASSGEFYLVNSLLKYNVDINAVDMYGLSAIHKAILGKKHAVSYYLLRESANPFIRDNDGATLMHYAVQTASSQAIKMLILYNVDINLCDNDGWTPLHLAVQTQRTDILKLLLIKGADRTIKNKDGLTPLDLCLCSGRTARTFELIKLLKAPPRLKTQF